MASTESEAKDKIKFLVKWFENLELPKKPFKIMGCITVENAKQYVETLTSRVNTLNLYSKEVQASYWSLQELKKYLEINDTSTF